MQAAVNLHQQTLQTVQCRSFACIVKKFIQPLLNELQVRQHFIGQRRGNRTLFGLAIKADQLRDALRILRLLTHRCIYLIGQSARLLLETSVYGLIVRHAAAPEHQRHCHIFANQAGIFRIAQVGRQGLDFFGQIMRRVMFQPVTFLSNFFHILDKSIARILVARNAQLPVIFSLLHLIAQFLVGLFFLGRIHHGGIVLSQGVLFPYPFYTIARGIAPSYQVEHFIEDMLNIARILFLNRSHLPIYPAQQFAHTQIAGQVLMLYAIEQTACYPPECPPVVLGYAVQYRIQSLFHRQKRACYIILLQPKYQATLILAVSRLDQRFDIFRLSDAQHALRQLHSQIGKEQILLE